MTTVDKPRKSLGRTMSQESKPAREWTIRYYSDNNPALFAVYESDTPHKCNWGDEIPVIELSAFQELEKKYQAEKERADKLEIKNRKIVHDNVAKYDTLKAEAQKLAEALELSETLHYADDAFMFDDDNREICKKINQALTDWQKKYGDGDTTK